jgi:hypothetical protein
VQSAKCFENSGLVGSKPRQRDETKEAVMQMTQWVICPPNKSALSLGSRFYIVSLLLAAELIWNTAPPAHILAKPFANELRIQINSIKRQFFSLQQN